MEDTKGAAGPEKGGDQSFRGHDHGRCRCRWCVVAARRTIGQPSDIAAPQLKDDSRQPSIILRAGSHVQGLLPTQRRPVSLGPERLLLSLSEFCQGRHIRYALRAAEGFVVVTSAPVWARDDTDQRSALGLRPSGTWWRPWSIPCSSQRYPALRGVRIRHQRRGSGYRDGAAADQATVSTQSRIRMGVRHCWWSMRPGT